MHFNFIIYICETLYSYMVTVWQGVVPYSSSMIMWAVVSSADRDLKKNLFFFGRINMGSKYCHCMPIQVQCIVSAITTWTCSASHTGIGTLQSLEEDQHGRQNFCGSSCHLLWSSVGHTEQGTQAQHAQLAVVKSAHKQKQAQVSNLQDENNWQCESLAYVSALIKLMGESVCPTKRN